ncbi:protein cereblon-like isoform X2 [Phlebotomus argentipes]|uniref:protein cereblon-like isoform X2 n=1 Tax=Phlebotomus argentipes TaxID=94469 RepID=UPI0028937948|nr:protein cereblon-like isoform X2 [Phlebotomus argentipes]
MKTRDKLLIELILLFCAYNLEANEETLLKDFLICRACGSDVALSNFLLYKVSPHAKYVANETLFEDQPTLVQELENPIGIRYRIVLLRHANCAQIDSWNNYYSWFPGYSWKLCLCSKCGTLLGWMYEPIDTALETQSEPTKDGFYAIILPNVISESFVNSLLMREKILREN